MIITRGFVDNTIVTRGFAKSILEKILEAICIFKRKGFQRVFTLDPRQRIFKKGC